MISGFFELSQRYGDVIGRIIASIFVFLALLIIRNFINDLLDRIMRGLKIAARNRVYGLKIEAKYAKPARHFVTLVLMGVGFLLLIGLWGLVDTFQGILVGAGIAAVVVGFAAQGALSDLIAGIMIVLDRPFVIGEWIKVEAVEGVVSDITLRSTRIRSFDGEFVTIPNRRMAEYVVVNRSRTPNLRLICFMGVDYDTDVGKAVDIALEVLKSQDKILEDPEPEVIVKDLGDSSINLELRFWVRGMSGPETRILKSVVITEVKKAFNKKGIKIPFPHRELIMHEKKK